ncbi:Glucose-6-phosphate isomerase,related [Neospora caninum Liverpool]|uniref:Glucose-6-phosphate isomerase, related n=1 Tax=Neospora caninum (strain Liverpool) TaxID=572307 RepID=F0VHA1_NEOCL|nr:Glucose-6-phosphate isomerase,related [Neospora caninum Liverpool]CBZ53095.1 Glucose-6-phosphate isomerase,related [Neospora caninum Liverpool]CEL67079.1 TPA: Glucose-6-phosphate isomerase, related [Neospora caninum Liverpool]|eukprot:XP_003883127.1 Glucose-6-phosphate isomerase,related [Neospora caninum Liverpool]
MEGPHARTCAEGESGRPLCADALRTPELTAPVPQPEGCCARQARLRLPGCISRSAGPAAEKGFASPFKCFTDMYSGFAGVSSTCGTPQDGRSPSTVSGASTWRSLSSCEEDENDETSHAGTASTLSLGTASEPCASPASGFSVEPGDGRGALSWLESVSAGDQGAGSSPSTRCPSEDRDWSWKPSAFYEFVADISTHFVLLEKLGEGSQGVVYRSQRLNPANPLANASEDGDAEVCLKFFLEEALPLPIVERLCRLRVPHVVRHRRAIHDCRGQWIVMDLARGPELLALIRQKHRESPERSWRRCGTGACKDRLCACVEQSIAGALDEAACSRYLRQMLTALAGLHAEGLIHGDVKAENFILAEPLCGHGGRGETPGLPPVLLSDLGSAVPVEAAQASRERRKAPAGAGTPMYMAPELFTKSGYDGKVDVWAAGVVFALLLTGCTPFGNTDVLSFLWQRYSSQQKSGCGFKRTAHSARTPRSGAVLVTRCPRENECFPDAADCVAPVHTMNSVTLDCMAVLASDIESAADLAPLLDPLIDAELSSGETWRNVSGEAKRVVRSLLRVDPRERPSAAHALADPWLTQLETGGEARGFQQGASRN